MIDKVALLLEIVGFCSASFFIALLKIEAISSLADRLKNALFNFTKRTDTPLKQVLLLTLVQILIQIIIGVPRITFPEGIKVWQYPKHLLSSLMFSYLVPIIQLILLYSLLLSLKVLDFVKSILAGKEIVTNFFIILGSIMVLIGLILELVASW